MHFAKLVSFFLSFFFLIISPAHAHTVMYVRIYHIRTLIGHIINEEAFLLLAGHKGGIRNLAVSDCEHFFLSSSKDKTVKLWSLRRLGAQSVAQQLTYAGHQKPVVGLELLEPLWQVASCDGSVHVCLPYSNDSMESMQWMIYRYC